MMLSPSRRVAVFAILLAAVSTASASDEAGRNTEAIPVEPSEDAILAAYRAWVESLNTRAEGVLGAEDAQLMTLVLEDVKKLRCDALDRADVQYDCRVEVRIRVADGAPKTRLVNLWLIHEGDEWVVR